MKQADQSIAVAQTAIPVTRPRLLHLVGSLPRAVAGSELSAMRWVLEHVAQPGTAGRGDGRPAVA